MLNKFKFSIVVAFFVATLGVIATPSFALDVEKMSYRDVDRWVGMPANKLRRELANKTINIKITSRASGKLKPFLRNGSLIVYTARGGKLYWWNAKYDTVQQGRWTTNTLMKGWELPCFRLQTAAGLSECYFGGAANYKEVVEGNPFNLQIGNPLPVRGSRNLSLKSMAKKLGL